MLNQLLTLWKMEKKSGFLVTSIANKPDNAKIYYQCKSCLSFLASTAKWDRHLATCFSKTSVAVGPVGFRMMTFITPFLTLERIRLAENSGSAGTTTERELCPTRKPGRATETTGSGTDLKSRPIQDKNGGSSDQEQTVRKCGRPRKFLTSWEECSQPQFQIPDFPVAEKNRKIGKVNPKKSRGRPKKNSSTNSNISSTPNQLAKKAEKNARKSAARRALRIKTAQNDVTGVRSFKFACPKCPAKFDTQGFYNIHVHNIHNGKRRLMTCCVCDRIFNKRDSLNSHYLAHEAAEAKEEKFNLFQPWTDECLEKVKLYRSNFTSNINCHRCKICFLTHFTHHSYLTHFRQEHSDPPESYRVTCKFEKCTEEFRSIRVYLEHAKANHARQFFGNLTLLRQQEGIFVGNRRVPVDKDGKLLYKQRVWTSKPKTNPEQDRNKSFKKLLSSSTPNESEVRDWKEENGISFDSTEMDEDEKAEEFQVEMPNERKIELERVHLGEDYVVKQEVDWKIKVEVDKD